MPKRKANRNGRPTGIKSFFENQRKRQHLLEQEAYGNPLDPFHPIYQHDQTAKPTASATEISSGGSATTVTEALRSTTSALPLQNTLPEQSSQDILKKLEGEAPIATETQLSSADTDTAAATAAAKASSEKEPISTITIQRFGSTTIAELPAQPLTMDPLVFDPSTYPVLDWPKNTKAGNSLAAPYSFLAQAFAIIADTSSRIITVNILCNMLRVLIIHTPSDILPTLWLCSNTIGASYKGIELGIGPLVLTKSLTAVSGATRQKLHQLYKDHGDWGDVAYAVKTSVRTIVQPKPLSITGVFKTLHTVASVEGKGTVNEKCKHVQRLLLAAKDNEARYIVRTCVGNLRIGAVGTTVLVAFAKACVLSLTPSSAHPSSLQPRDHQQEENGLSRENKSETLIRQPTDSKEDLMRKRKRKAASQNFF